MDMAPDPMPEPASQLPSLTSHRRPNLRNPLPLSAAQEGQVRDLYYKKVRGMCAAEIKEFADCARGRTVSAMWLCKVQRLAMNSCMIAHASPIMEDEAREEWFHGREESRKKREEDLAAVERRREEVIDLIKRQEEKEKLEKDRAELDKMRQRGGAGSRKGGDGWWK